jgi:short-subunit dehydrogenase
VAGRLIANARIVAGAPREGELESAHESRAVIETNVMGVLNTIHPLLPRMISRGHGQIGIVSSLAGFVPLPEAPSYCASKAAVLSYGLALRAAVEGRGVRVSVICPGYVTTPMTTKETGWKPFQMSAEKAADLAMRGLAANRAVVAFPAVLATLSWIGGILPDWLRRYTARPFRFTVPSDGGS